MRTTLLSTMKLRLIASFAMLMMMSTLVYGQLPIDETLPPGTLPIDCPVNVTTTYTTSLNSTLDCYNVVTLSATVEANGPGNSEPSTLQWQVDTGAGFVDYGDPVNTGTIGAGTEVTITRTFTVVEGTNMSAFAVKRMGVGMRWWEDVLGNGDEDIYPESIKEKYVASW